jgi:hypothetical protein
VVAAATAAEGCLAGLVAAAALPVAYGWAASAGWRWPAAAAAGIAAYLGVSSSLWWLPTTGAVRAAAGAAIGLTLACRAAAVLPLHAAKRGRVETMGAPRRRPGVARATAVSLVYFAALQVLRSGVASTLSARFITFPGASLSVLATTHAESGARTACRVAAAMPYGGLGMLAFLCGFRFAIPEMGLAGATALGYLMAVSTLAVAAAWSGPVEVKVALGRRAHRPRTEYRAMFARRTRHGRFSPAFEALAG